MYRVLGYWTVYCTQSGGGVHIFSKHKSNMYTFVKPRGVSIFSPKTQKCQCLLLYNKGGVGPEGNQITKVCTNVHTCMYICHLAPPPPRYRSTFLLIFFLTKFHLNTKLCLAVSWAHGKFYTRIWPKYSCLIIEFCPVAELWWIIGENNFKKWHFNLS